MGEIVSKIGRDSFLKIRKPVPKPDREMTPPKEYSRRKMRIRRMIEEGMDEYKKYKVEEE